MKTKRKDSAFSSVRNDKRKLESIFLFTTGKCNAKCAMCFYADDMAKKEQDLSFEQWKKLSESAPNFNRLWISGGEPTMREDLPEIIEMFYKNNHIKDINFPSNGMKPDLYISWIKRLRQSCPNMNITTSISFDGFGETHDRQRGVECFYKAAETIYKITENFKSDGKVIKNLATVITKYNVDQIIDFLSWVYGRFNVSSHVIECARGMTREDGVKVCTEDSLRALQDEAMPFYFLYAKRIAAGMNFIGRGLTRYFFTGLMKFMFNLRVANIEKPTCWGIECTAGETTLVIDYDGRFRGCELRDPIGKVQDYDCNIQKILDSEALAKEIDAVGHGYKANCWCVHGCWMMSSIIFNPLKMKSILDKCNKEAKKLDRPINITEEMLQGFESKYNIDTAKLKEIGILK